MTPQPSASPVTRPLLPLAWICLSLATAAILLTLLPRTLRAQSQARVDLARLRTISSQTEELAALRLKLAAHSAPGQPVEPLASTVSTVLAQVGLPASTLECLSPQSSTAEPLVAPGSSGINMPSLHRRRATLALGPITLPQLGRVLSAWSSTAPAWTTARIELAPLAGGRASPTSSATSISPGADLPLRALLALEYLDLAPPPPPPSVPALPTAATPRNP